MKGVAIVCVTNNLLTDQRADKHCQMLLSYGYVVLLVGRNWPVATLSKRKYDLKQLNLFFKRGAFFYAEYNIKLFFFLLFKKPNLVLANDLDTLPATYLATLFKRYKLIFDAHEYFTGVPEIQNKPFVKKIWTGLEKAILPKIKYCLTVNNSIAFLYKTQYNQAFNVVRNVPMANNFPTKIKSRKELGIDENDFVVILQGSGININRGAEELMASIKYLDDRVKILIIGSGDVWENLLQLSKAEEIKNRVQLINKMSYQKMLQYTYNANLGVTLDKPGNPNYDNSLPNKIFDYLYCGIPVLAGDLKEISKLINTYRVGLTIDKVDPESIANGIHYFLFNNSFYEECKKNTVAVKKDISWEKEYKSLHNWF